MAVGHKYNDKPAFMIAKLLTSATLHTVFMRHAWVLSAIFSALKTVFRIEWSAKEWTFRVSLDLYIVYGGMFCAYAYILLKEYRITEHPMFPPLVALSVATSVLGMVWFFWFELSLDKFTYNSYHPIACFVPIFSFIVLRNATPLLRSSSSRLFCFIGQCSLETFILQFHGWMASDTKGILLVIPGTQWRPLNLVISTICFVWMSHKVAGATGEITEWLVGKPKKASLPVPVTAVSLTTPETMAAFVQDAVERPDAGAVAGVPESIPLMNRKDDEKAAIDTRETSAVGEPTDGQRRGSLPNVSRYVVICTSPGLIYFSVDGSDSRPYFWEVDLARIRPD